MARPTSGPDLRAPLPRPGTPPPAPAGRPWGCTSGRSSARSGARREARNRRDAGVGWEAVRFASAAEATAAFRAGGLPYCPRTPPSVRRASAAAPQPASETDQRQEVVVPHLVASVEEVELDQTGVATDLPAATLDQRGR